MQIHLNKEERKRVLEGLASEITEAEVFVSELKDLQSKVADSLTIDGDDYDAIMGIFAQNLEDVEVEWE